MPDIDNQTNNLSPAPNWKENLLLKDDQGHLSYYQSKTPRSSGGTNNTTAVADLPKTASEDHFREDNYTKSKGKSGDKAEFSFHPEDKRDLESLAKNLPKDESKKYSVEKIADRIIEKQGLDFDQENRQSFMEALFNFLRSRKNSISTRQFISERIKSAGRVMPERTIDVIMSVIKGIKEKIISSGGLAVWQEQSTETPLPKDDKVELKPIVLEEDEDLKEPPQAVIDKALSSLAVDKKTDFSLLKENNQANTSDADKEKPKELKENKEADIETAKSFQKTENNDQLVDKNLAKEAVDKNKTEPKTEPIQSNENKADFSLPKEKESKPEPSATSAESLPKVSRPLAADSIKKQMSDVLTKSPALPKKSAPKAVLTGPVMEIGSLDLTAFRRLGQSPQERVEKIISKINLLEKDSFTKKAQGIAAWRSSPLHQLYLSLGAQSMGQDKVIEEFLAEQKKANPDHLDLEEFSAIADLNKKLRF